MARVETAPCNDSEERTGNRTGLRVVTQFPKVPPHQAWIGPLILGGVPPPQKPFVTSVPALNFERPDLFPVLTRLHQMGRDRQELGEIDFGMEPEAMRVRSNACEMATRNLDPSRVSFRHVLNRRGQ
jgi:hypothetical protein